MGPGATVHIVEDDPDLRQTLQDLVESVGLAAVTYRSGTEFLERAAEAAAPACVVLDVRLPGVGGLEVQRQLRQRGLDLPVILMSGHADVPIAVEGMKNGATDFLVKPFNKQALLEVVQRSIVQNETLARSAAERRDFQERFGALTEREVLELLVGGQSNKEVGRTLGISFKTVEAHRASIMRKMGFDSFAQLVEATTRFRGG